MMCQARGAGHTARPKTEHNVQAGGDSELHRVEDGLDVQAVSQRVDEIFRLHQLSAISCFPNEDRVVRDGRQVLSVEQFIR